ncbi:TraB/GumN family protein [Rhizobium sp. KVB221]|uniref:TraB/GumN family protein n=1 Tax=Rhizobium setariae TaxID=2801340 RepID=A0A936YNX6_9HYPH|nr:TraB/GumN family protein [Rhizobium setariae]MBL0374069.1 TraB/GumN family protein [Rhizobium setariae]
MSFAAPNTKSPTRWLTSAIADRLANGALFSLIAIHLLAALSLVFILAFVRPAQAAEDIACGAKDLVAELRKTDPTAYAKLKAEGDAVKNSGSRFWKLEKPGQEPDWLLGTMHLSDPRVTDMPTEAKAAFDKASTVLLESDEILDQARASAKLMAKPDLLMFSGNATIRDYLNPADQIVLEQGLKKRGIPLATVIKMKPYILSSMVALSSCELSRKASGAPFLDMKLAKDGQASGKAVKGVETLAEQIEAMASLPMDFHVRSLVSIVRYPQFTADMMETTLGLYLEGNIGMVFPASTFFAPEKSDSDFKDMAVFERRLITDRNHHMADRGAPILAEGNVFMAVGALHLIGDEGLIELLKKKGYKATPVM